MATKYRNRNNDEYPSGPMLRGIEESCLYLIELGKSAKLDLDEVLNHTKKNGDTLLADASIFSEKITRQLLIEDVRVNSINHMFVTPFFRVSSNKNFSKITFDSVQKSETKNDQQRGQSVRCFLWWEN